MVTFCKLLACSKGDLNPLIDQLLEFFPQMTKSVATRLTFTAFNREDEIPTEIPVNSEHSDAFSTISV